jgi:hypothetical protein
MLCHGISEFGHSRELPTFYQRRIFLTHNCVRRYIQTQAGREEIEGRTGRVWDKVIEPKPEGIRAAVSIVRTNMKRGICTFVNVNNHYEGSAPLTIERLLEVLAGGDR